MVDIPHLGRLEGAGEIIPTLLDQFSPCRTGIFSVDISTFALSGTGDILLLYTDVAPARNSMVLPVADSSERCYDGSNVCSVVLPNGSSQLFIYGIADAIACPTAINNILLYDIVCEIVVDELSVGGDQENWGTLKSSYGSE